MQAVWPCPVPAALLRVLYSALSTGYVAAPGSTLTRLTCRAPWLFMFVTRYLYTTLCLSSLFAPRASPTSLGRHQSSESSPAFTNPCDEPSSYLCNRGAPPSAVAPLVSGCALPVSAPSIVCIQPPHPYPRRRARPDPIFPIRVDL